MIKLSIIIPVYNTRKYLSKCLDSIVNQNIDFSEVELIIINDGSTDGGEIILEKYAEKYPFIKVYHQENQGSASAKNLGLSKIKGEYVTVIDSDDEIYKNVLAEIIDYIKVNDLDICYLKYDTYDEAGCLLAEIENIGQQNMIKSGIEHERRTLTPVFYKSELIVKNNIKFPHEVMIGEDSVLNVKTQFFAQRVSSFDLPYYKYMKRISSVSNQGRSEKAFESFKNALIEIRNFENQVSKKSEAENIYFRNVYHIFITRILELNILPALDEEKYQQTTNLLTQLHLKELMKWQDEKYPCFSSNFYKFKKHQQILRLKTRIHRFIFRK
ncbi:MAG: glycosyltransferase [Flavobacteriaceae bacterium]|jgi:glycosyltransferase involved in cell wall biosynthesis|nr:glycosyltransferase [Flavobacteriaceae bacterium]